MKRLLSNQKTRLNFPPIFHPVFLLLLGYGISAVILLSLTHPIPQDQNYHDFADRRSLIGIPNFGDVASNGLILIGGLAGLAVLWRLWVKGGEKPRDNAEYFFGLPQGLWLLFFFSACITVVGSTYYHWEPGDARLVWDRLPFSLLISGFPAVLIAERTVVKGWRFPLLLLWLLIGPISVMVWQASGDLRLYGLLQPYAFLGTLVFFFLLKSKYADARYIGLAVTIYVLAKVFEDGDAVIYSWGGLLSGHTLKHLSAGAAVLLLASMLARRQIR